MWPRLPRYARTSGRAAPAATGMSMRPATSSTRSALRVVCSTSALPYTVVTPTTSSSGLRQVGLDYIRLGQPLTTLSGGESQRLKLAAYMARARRSGTLFIFDEPTTGLHFHDVERLLWAFNELIDQGHSVVVIEHNTEVVKCADHIIDLGPEGGDKG